MTVDSTEAGFQRGTISRLNLAAGFGYVRDATGENAYTFLTGAALPHSKACRLALGLPVEFRLMGRGRVEELRLCEAGPRGPELLENRIKRLACSWLSTW